MTPVISPWVFYLILLSNKLLEIFGTLAVGLAVLTVICVAAKLCNQFDYRPSEELDKALSKLIKVMLPSFILSTLIWIVTPSETTITKMIVAQNVTYERVDVVTDTVENVYNDIMELFEESE